MEINQPSLGEPTQHMPTDSFFTPDVAGLYRRRDPTSLSGLWPDDWRDRVALLTCLSLAPFVAFFEIYLVLPFNMHQVWQSDDFPYCTAIFVAIVAINVYGNLWKLMRTSPSATSLPSIQLAGYRYCSQCKCNAPPRAYHCPTCEICVWKRDHHCSFAGVCVGYFNHRYYLMTVFYAFIACFFCCWWHSTYITSFIPGGLSMYTFWQLFMPHVAFIYRQDFTNFMGITQLLVTTMGMVVASCTIICAYFLVAQLFCLVRGQTRPEYLLGVTLYNHGLAYSMYEVLGKQWYLALFIPFAPSQLIGNGQKFVTTVDHIESNVKDM